VDFEVYCDESRSDVLCGENAQSRYLVIGSLWMPAASRDLFKRGRDREAFVFTRGPEWVDDWHRVVRGW